MKKIFLHAFIIVSIISSFPLVSGFEAHVVNVTAKIERRPCIILETRSYGFWKNHPEFRIFPQTLGNEEINDNAEADAIFDLPSNVMLNKLKKQLLALKFNVSYFNSGQGLVPGENTTVAQIIIDADDMIVLDPSASNSALENMKDRIESANVAHTISTCPDHDRGDDDDEDDDDDGDDGDGDDDEDEDDDDDDNGNGNGGNGNGNNGNNGNGGNGNNNGNNGGDDDDDDEEEKEDKEDKDKKVNGNSSQNNQATTTTESSVATSTPVITATSTEALTPHVLGETASTSPIEVATSTTTGEQPLPPEPSPQIEVSTGTTTTPEENTATATTTE